MLCALAQHHFFFYFSKMCDFKIWLRMKMWLYFKFITSWNKFFTPVCYFVHSFVRWFATRNQMIWWQDLFPCAQRMRILSQPHSVQFTFCYTFITLNHFNSIRERDSISLSISHSSICSRSDTKRRVRVHSASQQRANLFHPDGWHTAINLLAQKKEAEPISYRYWIPHILWKMKEERKIGASAIDRTSIEDHRQNLIRSIPAANRISADPKQSD